MATRTVGSTKTYATMAAAIAAAGNGDRIEVDPETFTDDNIDITQDNITIIGVGATRSKMVCTSDIANGKGIFVQSGDNLTVENIEFQGAQVADGNGAGIRANTTANDITITNCSFHDGEDGFQGGGSSGFVTIERCEFYGNGTGTGQQHNVYVSAGTTLTFRYNWSHDCDAGHLLKTRAALNYIEYNRLTGQDGDESYCIDIPDCGRSYVIGNLIEKNSGVENNTLLSYGAEGEGNTTKELYVVNNTFMNNYGSSGIHIFVRTGTTGKAQNNLFLGGGTDISGGSLTEATNLEATSAELINSALHNYYLAATSTAINAGSSAGTGAGYSLTPNLQYVHPCSQEARPTFGTIDIGAYEWWAPSWVTALDVGEWYEIPNTDIAAVDPSPVPAGNSGIGSKVRAWNSMVVNPLTSTLYSCAAGGHTDYSGNEVDALDLETETPGWVEVLAPSASVSNANYYSDGRPTSRHIYYAITFDIEESRIMLFGGSRYSDGGFGHPIDSFNLVSGSYSPEDTHPDGQHDYGIAHAFDPSTGNVYMVSYTAGGLFRWAWARGAGSYAGQGAISVSCNGYKSASAIDPTRNRLLVVGGDNSDHCLYNITAGTWSSITLGDTFASTVQNETEAAMFYVPELDVFLWKASGGGDGAVVQIHPTTWACTAYTTSGGDNIPAAPSGLLHNKFLYVPKLGGCVIYPEYGENAWFLKLFDVQSDSQEVSSVPFRGSSLGGLG